MARLILLPSHTDYAAHLEFAREMWATGTPVLPHFLFHLAAWPFASLLGDDGRRPGPSLGAPAGFLVTALAFQALTAVVLHRYLERCLPKDRAVPPLTLGLLLVAPIPLLFPVDHGWLYYGYIGITAYHNPTVIALRPFALLLFGAVAAGLAAPVAIRGMAKVAALTVVGVLAKPSFLVCFAPAASLRFLGLLARRSPSPGAADAMQPEAAADAPARPPGTATSHRPGAINGLLVLLAMIVPGVLVLLWQYQVAYETGRDTVVFAPFRSLGLTWKTLPKIALSVAFPLCVAVSLREQAMASGRLRLSWLTFGFGMAGLVLLAEEARPTHMNFLWGPQVALWIVFIESAVVLRRAQRERADGAEVCRAWWRAHLGAGIAYYLSTLAQGRFM